MKATEKLKKTTSFFSLFYFSLTDRFCNSNSSSVFTSFSLCAFSLSFYSFTNFSDVNSYFMLFPFIHSCLFLSFVARTLVPLRLTFSYDDQQTHRGINICSLAVVYIFHHSMNGKCFFTLIMIARTYFDMIYLDVVNNSFVLLCTIS